MADAQARPSYGALFRVPAILPIVVSMVVSRTATSMASLVLVVFALQEYGSPAIAGLVTFAAAGPAVLVGPIAGALLDRYGRARLVIVDHLVGAMALGLIATLVLADSLPAWLLIAITAVASLTRPLSMSGLRSLLPLIVPRYLWERVNAVDSNAFVFGSLVGPAAGGIAVGTLGGPGALLLVSGMLVVAALILLAVPDHIAPTRAGGAILSAAWQGVVYTWRNRALRGLAASLAAYYAGFGVLTILVPVLLLREIGVDPPLVGLTWATSALFGGIGALFFGSRQSAGRERIWLVGSALTTAGATAILLLPPSFALVVVAIAIAGFTQGPIDIANFTLRQRATDPAWLGRAFAVSIALNSAGYPVATAIAGGLVEGSLYAAIGLAIGLFLTAAVLGNLMLSRFAVAEPARSARQEG